MTVSATLHARQDAGHHRLTLRFVEPDARHGAAKCGQWLLQPAFEPGIRVKTGWATGLLDQPADLIAQGRLAEPRPQLACMRCGKTNCRIAQDEVATAGLKQIVPVIDRNPGYARRPMCPEPADALPLPEKQPQPPGRHCLVGAPIVGYRADDSPGDILRKMLTQPRNRAMPVGKPPSRRDDDQHVRKFLEHFFNGRQVAKQLVVCAGLRVQHAVEIQENDHLQPPEGWGSRSPGRPGTCRRTARARVQNLLPNW